MFWIAILFYLGVNGFRHLYGDPQEITAWRILATVFFIHGWSPQTINNVVPGGWTIAIEMNFYLLLPFLYQKIKSLNKAIFFFFATLTFSFLANALFGKWLMATDIPVNQTEPFLYFWLPVLTVCLVDHSALRMFRSIEIDQASSAEMVEVLAPTLAYAEDELGERPSLLRLCGFENHAQVGEELGAELGLSIERVHSPLGTIGASNAGLLGMLATTEVR